VERSDVNQLRPETAMGFAALYPSYMPETNMDKIDFKKKPATLYSAPPASLRLEPLDEGRCLQRLHIGSYDDEGPTLARLHNEIMPAQGVRFAGPHHEIYLSDPRKTTPEKLKTILRQPVRSAG
jgi:hypothetical protein